MRARPLDGTGNPSYHGASPDLFSTGGTRPVRSFDHTHPTVYTAQSESSALTLDDTPAPTVSLRERIRQDSAALHHTLDKSLGSLCLLDPVGLTAFLKINERGLSALAGYSGTGGRIAADLVDRLRRDLAILGTDPLPPAPPLPADLSPLAVDYVVLGSRLGTSVLRRDWVRATHPLVQRACNYFTAPAQVDAWRAFCGQTGNMPSSGQAADCVSGDILQIFRLFCRSADLTSHGTTPCLKDTDERQ